MSSSHANCTNYDRGTSHFIPTPLLRSGECTRVQEKGKSGIAGRRNDLATFNGKAALMPARMLS